MESNPVSEIPFVPWDRFMRKVFAFKQGEHITLVGPTGRGKTTLARELIKRRKYVVVFASKRKDELLSAMKQDGHYEVTKHFDGVGPGVDKFVLDPGHGRTLRDTKAIQEREFRHALELAHHQGNWCVYVDEGKRICDILKLAPECEMIWQEGRSLGVSLVMSVQRPVKIPLAAYDQPTHLFFWRDMDEANLKRIGGIGGTSNKLIRETVASLEGHNVLYLNTRSGEMAITKADI